MEADERADEPVEAAIIAVDEALCASLVLLLAASGIRSAPLASLSELPNLPAPKLIVVDWALLKQANSDPAEAVRRVAGMGGVIIMMDDEQIPPLLGAEFASCMFLTKPFIALDILSFLRERRGDSWSEAPLCSGPAEASSRLDGDSSLREPAP